MAGLCQLLQQQQRQHLTMQDPRNMAHLASSVVPQA